MHNSRNLSDQELIDASHRWRRLSLGGSVGALNEATRHEAELRRRFGDVDQSMWPHPNGPGDRYAKRVAKPQTVTAIVDKFIIAAAEPATQSDQALRDLLHNLRVLLEMDIAFVAEFVDGYKVYRHIDYAADDQVRVKAGDSGLLETTLCQRVVDGRLPELLADARSEPELTKLSATKALNIGAYLSTPVVLRDGRVYGTLCCISHAPRSAMGSRQIDALRYVAGIVAAELDKRHD